MARDEANVVAEREQSLADRADQLVVVAAREVGSTDRTLEQDVTYECES